MPDHSILVVDDDPAIRTTVEDILLAEGYTVITAEHGAHGLALLGEAAPSLILLDMRMPILDGWGFARELRRRGIAIPILMMTATNDITRWANEIEATAFLAKPFDLEELLSTIEGILAGPGDARDVPSGALQVGGAAPVQLGGVEQPAPAGVSRPLAPRPPGT